MALKHAPLQFADAEDDDDVVDRTANRSTAANADERTNSTAEKAMADATAVARAGSRSHLHDGIAHPREEVDPRAVEDVDVDEEIDEDDEDDEDDDEDEEGDEDGRLLGGMALDGSEADYNDAWLSASGGKAHRRLPPLPRRAAKHRRARRD